jgi:RimJ/RimL family protein N-acetyltransferase
MAIAAWAERREGGEFTRQIKIELPFLILTKDLIIRPLINEDKITVNTAIRESIRELNMWLPWVDGKPSFADVDAMCDKFYDQANNGEATHFVVYHNDKFMGMCSFLETNFKSMATNLGYWSRVEENQESRFVDAINAVMRYGFEVTGIVEFNIPCVVGNYTSELAAKKLNFKLQGIDLIAHKQIKKFIMNDLSKLPKIDFQWIKDSKDFPKKEEESGKVRDEPKSFINSDY